MTTFPVPFKTFNAFLGFAIMIWVLTRMAILLIVNVYHSSVNLYHLFFWPSLLSKFSITKCIALKFRSSIYFLSSSRDYQWRHFSSKHAMVILLISFTSSQFLLYCYWVSPLADITSVKLIKFLWGLLVELLSRNLKNLSTRLPVRSCTIKE